MLDKFAINQIWSLLYEGYGIRTVARMTGVARNIVRRSQRNMPRPNRETCAAMLEAERLAHDPGARRFSDEEEALRELKS